MSPARDLPTTTPERWTEDLVLALRLADVRGTEIGDAVRVVEEHCAQSGEHPAEAFGTPDAYARDLVASLPATASLPQSRLTTPAIALGASSGTMLLLAGVSALADDRRAVIGTSDVATVAVVVVAALFVERLMTALLQRVWPVALALAAGILVPVGLTMLVTGDLVTLSPTLALGLGAAVLAATAVTLAVTLRRHTDPVVDPVTGADTRPMSWGARAALLAPVAVLAAGIALAATRPGA